jgi:hypothetical protein
MPAFPRLPVHHDWPEANIGHCRKGVVRDLAITPDGHRMSGSCCSTRVEQ